MSTPSRSARFRALHVPGNPLVLVNAWDAGSAAAIAESGAAAIATSSWAIAAAHGYQDGERIPAELAFSALARIAAVVTLPLTVDVESGYGGTAAAVARTVEHVIGLGASGCNLEDGHTDGRTLRHVNEQVELVAAARGAADRRDPQFFVNARTDVFMVPAEGVTREEQLREVVARADAYARAGADGLFVPGLTDVPSLATLVREVKLPVNVMLLDLNAPLDEYRRAGVARISYGPAPYLAAMGALRSAAKSRLQ